MNGERSERTLRDDFAAAAITGLAMNNDFVAFTRGFYQGQRADEPCGWISTQGYRAIAIAAYAIADAMLEVKDDARWSA